VRACVQVSGRAEMMYVEPPRPPMHLFDDDDDDDDRFGSGAGDGAAYACIAT